MPKVGSNYVCLAVILIDFVFKNIKSIFHKYFLKNVNISKKKKRWFYALLRI